MGTLIQPFQSTRPIRGATSIRDRVRTNLRNFNPRAPYGARHVTWADIRQMLKISIHAPHTGRDHTADQQQQPEQLISIHAPHTGRDNLTCYHYTIPPKISIHAPHTGRDWRGRYTSADPDHFNPHAPYGARRAGAGGGGGKAPFQSTRPIRGATRLQRCQDNGVRISIHAPHTGRVD